MKKQEQKQVKVLVSDLELLKQGCGQELGVLFDEAKEIQKKASDLQKDIQKLALGISALQADIDGHCFDLSKGKRISGHTFMENSKAEAKRK